MVSSSIHHNKIVNILYINIRSNRHDADTSSGSKTCSTFHPYYIIIHCMLWDIPNLWDMDSSCRHGWHQSIALLINISKACTLHELCLWRARRLRSGSKSTGAEICHIFQMFPRAHFCTSYRFH